MCAFVPICIYRQLNTFLFLSLPPTLGQLYWLLYNYEFLTPTSWNWNGKLFKSLSLLLLIVTYFWLNYSKIYFIPALMQLVISNFLVLRSFSNLFIFNGWKLVLLAHTNLLILLDFVLLKLTLFTDVMYTGTFLFRNEKRGWRISKEIVSLKDIIK